MKVGFSRSIQTRQQLTAAGVLTVWKIGSFSSFFTWIIFHGWKCGPIILWITNITSLFQNSYPFKSSLLIFAHLNLEPTLFAQELIFSSQPHADWVIFTYGTGFNSIPLVTFDLCFNRQPNAAFKDSFEPFLGVHPFPNYFCRFSAQVIGSDPGWILIRRPCLC